MGGVLATASAVRVCRLPARAPHSSCHICTAGDDAQALIWDLSAMARPASVVAGGSAGGGGGGGGGGGAGAAVTGLDPILAYSAGAEICGLQWSSAAPDWVAICFANKMQILRV